MGDYRRDCRKAVAGSISVNRDLTTLALVAFFTTKKLDAEGWRRSASISNTLKPEVAADASVGLVDLLLENANLQEVIKLRNCEDVALFATSVLMPEHIKR